MEKKEVSRKAKKERILKEREDKERKKKIRETEKTEHSAVKERKQLKKGKPLDSKKFGKIITLVIYVVIGAALGYTAASLLSKEMLKWVGGGAVLGFIYWFLSRRK